MFQNYLLLIIFGSISLLTAQQQSNWCSSCDDPHISTFDSLDYEFHELGQHYILYTDFEDILVTASYKPCAEDTTLTCNCALYVKFRDTILFIDTCGISTLDSDLKFYFTLKGRFRAYTAVCDSKLINPADETNNAWWNKAGNAVSINTRLLCAKMKNTDTYVIRTNNVNPDSNIFVRVVVHPLGISCIYIKPSPKSYSKTGGLCGLWNGNDADDGYIIGSKNKKTFLDLPYDTTSITQMGKFWRLTKFASVTQKFKFFDTELFCPCDTPNTELYDTDLPYWLLQESGRFCYNLVSKCVSRTADYTPRIQGTVRRVRSTKASTRTAQETCNKNILQSDIQQVVDAKIIDIDPIMKMCICDFTETNDMYWSMTHANLARNLAIISIGQNQAKPQHLRIGSYESSINYSIYENKTLMESLKVPISKRFANFTDVMYQGEDTRL